MYVQLLFIYNFLSFSWTPFHGGRKLRRPVNESTAYFHSYWPLLIQSNPRTILFFIQPTNLRASRANPVTLSRCPGSTAPAVVETTGNLLQARRTKNRVFGFRPW